MKSCTSWCRGSASFFFTWLLHWATRKVTLFHYVTAESTTDRCESRNRNDRRSGADRNGPLTVCLRACGCSGGVLVLRREESAAGAQRACEERGAMRETATRSCFVSSNASSFDDRSLRANETFFTAPQHGKVCDYYHQLLSVRWIRLGRKINEKFSQVIRLGRRINKQAVEFYRGKHVYSLYRSIHWFYLFTSIETI